MECAFDDSDEPISYVTGKFLSSQGPLGCDAMQCCGRIPGFQRTILPNDGGSKVL
jgi:hypothetical protein